MMPQDKEVFTPAEAFKRSSELFRNLTGKTSPDIVLFASCLWYAAPSPLPSPSPILGSTCRRFPCTQWALTSTLTLNPTLTLTLTPTLTLETDPDPDSTDVVPTLAWLRPQTSKHLLFVLLVHVAALDRSASQDVQAGILSAGSSVAAVSLLGSAHSAAVVYDVMPFAADRFAAAQQDPCVMTSAVGAVRRDLHSWINVGGDDTLFSAKQGTTAQPCLGEDRLRLYMSNMQAYVDMLRCCTTLNPTLMRTLTLAQPLEPPEHAPALCCHPA